jgi:hypothetical protein
VIPVEPFDEGRNDREIMARSASYTIPALAPHAEIAFQVSFRGNVPKIRISSVEQPMYVTPRSFETVFARYELLVLALLIGLTLLAAVPISLITLRLFEK